LYAGRLKAGDTIWNAKTGNKHRVSRILKVQADKYIELQEAIAGDIVALVGPKQVKTGDTLTTGNDAFHWEIAG